MELTGILTLLRETKYFMKYAVTTPELSFRIRHSAQQVINLDSDDQDD